MTSSNRKQNKVISVRVDDDAKDLIKEIASASCLSVSAYAKACMLGKDALRLKHQKGKPTPDMVLLSQLLAQMGSIGNNINQIAKKMNQGGIRPSLAAFLQAKEDMKHVKKTLENAINGKDKQD